ncbi:MAG: Ig-like domain-containing protein [Clostridia bacterium]|nr:Ig-like domain-containing protein [Clostridia bacterium]
MKKLFCTVLLFIFTVTNLIVSAATDSSLYTSNLFGNSFYNCDVADIGAVRYTQEVDSEVYHEGTASVKLTGTGRQLFVKTVDEDLRGKTAEISFWVKADTTASFTSPAKLTYNICYNDGSEKELTAVEISDIGTISKSGWQRFKQVITVDDAELPDNGTYTGIKFSVWPNGSSPVMLNNGAIWIDQISLKVIPQEGELPTTVTAMSATQNSEGLTEGVILTLDTDFISEESIENMTTSLNGQSFTAYTAVIKDLGDTSNIEIEFDSAQMLNKFSVSGIKDIWGYDVAVNASIMVETVQTFTENLLGEKFTKCESNDLGSGTGFYTGSVDYSVKYDGEGSLKRSASSGWNLFKGTFAVDDMASLGDNLSLSFALKKSEDATITSVAAGSSAEKITGWKLYLAADYTDKDGEAGTTKEVQITVTNQFEDNTEWHFIRYTFALKSLKELIPSGAKVTSMSVAVRPNTGPNSTLTGSVWLDKIILTKIPESDKYVPEFVGTNPADGETAAPTDKIVFKFNGAVEAGLITAENVLINGSSQPVEISGTYDGIYSEITIEPTEGFENKKEYTVKLTGLYDIWGRALPDDYEADFTTIDKFTVTSSFVSVDGEGNESTITAMQSGKIKAKFVVSNNMPAEKTAVLVIAACSGDTIKRFAISGETTIGAGETEQISATVTAEAGEYVRAFLWDGTSTHRPMSEIAELR